MKLYPFAAAALLFAGGSALAYAPAPGIAKTDLSMIADKGAKLATFKADDKAAAMAAAYLADAKPAVVPAAAVTWNKADPIAAGDPDLDLAETSIDEGAPPEPMVSDNAQPAMGGPLVETAAADLTTRPASQNYPACSPGPGDDNCIQLYESGVRTALAEWTAPTGGLSDGTQVAMGGPEEEPIADGVTEAEAEHLSMNGDGRVDEELGETQDLAAI